MTSTPPLPKYAGMYRLAAASRFIEALPAGHDALTRLREWNRAACEPPLDDATITNILAGATKRKTEATAAAAKPASLEGLVRTRIHDAIANGRDPAVAVMNALREHETSQVPVIDMVIGEVRRVEIHRGTENVYRILLSHGLEDGLIELSQKDLAEGQKRFVEKYLQNFQQLLVFPKGSWSEFVDRLLNGTFVILHDGIEEVSEETLAVEGFEQRVKKMRPVRDIHVCLREEDRVYWEEESGHILIPSERVNRYLKSTASKVPIEKFGHMLRERGIALKTSFQKKVPPQTESGKSQNIHFWRLDAGALGFTLQDIVTADPTDLPADPSLDHQPTPAEGHE